MLWFTFKTERIYYQIKVEILFKNRSAFTDKSLRFAENFLPEGTFVLSHLCLFVCDNLLPMHTFLTEKCKKVASIFTTEESYETDKIRERLR